MAGVVLVAFLLGTAFGARSLNAIVVPGLVVLAAGYLQLRSIEAPTVVRETPPNGFVGETHAVTLRFRAADGDAIDRPFVARLRDEVTDGLELVGEPPATAVGTGAVEYEVEYSGRGRQRFGPLWLSATDVFGLFEAELRCRSRSSCVVYPAYYPIRAWIRRDVFGGEDIGESRQRDEFDRLREYDRGDALRDIHWPTTAKRNELVVKTFAAETERSEITIVGGGVSGSGDRLATAVTSIALDLLDAGVPVEIVLPNGREEIGRDRGRLPAALELLATLRAGPARDVEADVVVDATRTETLVGVDDRQFRFERLTLGGEHRQNETNGTDELADRQQAAAPVANAAGEAP